MDAKSHVFCLLRATRDPNALDAGEAAARVPGEFYASLNNRSLAAVVTDLPVQKSTLPPADTPPETVGLP